LKILAKETQWNVKEKQWRAHPVTIKDRFTDLMYRIFIHDDMRYVADYYHHIEMTEKTEGTLRVLDSSALSSTYETQLEQANFTGSSSGVIIILNAHLLSTSKRVVIATYWLYRGYKVGFVMPQLHPDDTVLRIQVPQSQQKENIKVTLLRYKF
jgi:hypothetical protein